MIPLPGWLTGIGMKLAVAGAFVLLLLGAVLKLIGIGRKAEKAEAQTKILKDVEVRHEVDRTVAREPDPAGKLQSRWSRD